MTAPRQKTGRFAPSPTGPAHPGTMLSGLLVWLDARANDASCLLRLEDIDPNRAKREWSDALVEDLHWLGLDWDDITVQTEQHDAHEAALDTLAEHGLLYGCTCSRGLIKRTAALAADGSRRYPGTCQHRRLDKGTWRTFEGAVRFRVPSRPYIANLLAGGSHTFYPAQELGDPVIRRKDGAVAYHLAVVVDDITAGVTRVVRGRDLVFATGIHLALYEALRAPAPSYYHHLLLMEPRPVKNGTHQKLAKLHGSVGASELRRIYAPDVLCGLLAHCVNLIPTPRPITPRALLGGFDVMQLPKGDRIMQWDGKQLMYEPLDSAATEATGGAL